MSDPLSSLTDALVELRRFWERPDRRRRFLSELGEPIELGVLRVLLAVDQGRDLRPDAPGPCVNDVASHLSVSPSTASRLLDQAVTGGYLVRVPEPEDRRRSHLEITDAGRELLARTDVIRRRWLHEITADWAAEDVERLAALLARFVRDATARPAVHR